jgi:hypothetical protein
MQNSLSQELMNLSFLAVTIQIWLKQFRRAVGGDGTSDAVNYPNARSRVNYVTKSQCFDGEVPYILFVEVRVPPRQKKNTM